MTDRAKGIFLALLGPALWGIMSIFIRPLDAAGITCMEITFARCMIGGGAYMLVMALVHPAVLRVDIKGLLVCMMYGVCSYGIGFVSYSIAVTRISVAVATVLMFTAPVWVTMLNALLFRERPERSQVFAILVCFVGAILTADLLGGRGGSVEGGLDPLGVIFSLVNSLGMATQLIIPRFFNGKYEKDTMIIYGFFGAGLACTLFMDFGDFRVLAAGDGEGLRLLLCLLAMGILCTFLSNGSYVKASQYLDTVSVSILSAMEVVVGVLVSYLVFHESMTVLQGIGAVIIVFGALYPNIKYKVSHSRGCGGAE